jgi:hypothetical protein
MIGAINTLLSGTSLTWFTPFSKFQSPLLNNFEAFKKNFGVSFGNPDK